VVLCCCEAASEAASCAVAPCCTAASRRMVKRRECVDACGLASDCLPEGHHAMSVMGLRIRPTGPQPYPLNGHALTSCGLLACSTEHACLHHCSCQYARLWPMTKTTTSHTNILSDPSDETHVMLIMRPQTCTSTWLHGMSQPCIAHPAMP
jgi:hypothetical protein